MLSFESLYRRSLLGIADASPVKNFIKSQGWKLGVGRFVAGETLDQTLPAIHALEQDGRLAILDLLGEFIDSEAGVEAMLSEIMRTLEVIATEPIDRYMSVKPTQLGLGISEELALENARAIVTRAAEIDTHICLDMENYPFVEGTLWLYKTLLADGFDNVSTVLQSYLHRSLDDLADLLAQETKPTLRIVKGAYRESAEVAFQNKAEVDANFRDMMYAGLDGGAKINIATHDESIIREAEAYLRGAKLAEDRYEFQLLYGVKPALQKRLVEAGYTVRIYIPYGEDWYGYFSRRLAERPANMLFVLRGMFG